MRCIGVLYSKPFENFIAPHTTEYRYSTFLKTELRALGIQLETALRENMKDNRSKEWVKMLVRVRRLIETVIGQLAGRFHFEKIWAIDMWHLMSRINRKLLAHTVCFWLNRHNPEPLQINSLVSA